MTRILTVYHLPLHPRSRCLATSTLTSRTPSRAARLGRGGSRRPSPRRSSSARGNLGGGRSEAVATRRRPGASSQPPGPTSSTWASWRGSRTGCGGHHPHLWSSPPGARSCSGPAPSSPGSWTRTGTSTTSSPGHRVECKLLIHGHPCIQ